MQTFERRKEIIAASFDLISIHGIQELTIKKIAAVIGVSEPALYRHFSSKTDILSAVLDEMTALRNAAFVQIRANSRSAIEMIRSFFLVQARLFEATPSLTIMLFPEELFRNDEVLLGKASVMMAETLSRFQELLLAGIDEGAIRADIDSQTIALMLVGGFRLLVASWRLDSGISTAANKLEAAAKCFVDGSMALIER